MNPNFLNLLMKKLTSGRVSYWRSFSCSGYASQTRKSELGQRRATTPTRSRCRYRVRSASSTVGTHEANLCRFHGVTHMVRAQQESVLHTRMAARRLGNLGGSNLQLVPEAVILADVSCEEEKNCLIIHSRDGAGRVNVKMELGPLPYPRKRTAPTVSRSPKAASGAAAMHGVLYHRSGVFSICCPTECFGG
jgi:hypothetical protein